MRRLISLFILLYATNCAHGQYFTVTNLSGTALYGSTNVTVTSSGAAASTPYCGVNPYWIGTGAGMTTPSPGSYTFSFSSPVSAIRIYTSAQDVGYALIDTEKIGLTINGVFYPLTLANLTTYTGTCGQPPVTVLAGWLTPLIHAGSGAGGQVDVALGMISSCKVETNGFDNGSTFSFQFIGGPTNNGPLCSGDTLKLYWNGDSTGATYYWYGPGGFTSTLQNPVRPLITVADSGLYHVVKTVGGIPDTGATRLIIKPNPLLTASSNSPICQGISNTLTLFATPDSIGETYSWSGPASFTSTLRNPTISGFVAADTGMYYITATWRGCKSTDSTHVILAPVPPPPVVSGVTTYCTGQTFVPFTVAGTGTILWYTSGTGGTGSTTAPVVSMGFGGTYTFWATQTILGCESNRDSITVTVHVTPAPPVITGTSIYCQYYPYVPPTATGLNILWYTTATGGTGSTTVPIVNTNIAGLYTIYATQRDSGCTSARGPFNITVNPKPVPPVVVNNPGNYCPGQAFVPHIIVSGSGVLWYAAATGGTGTVASPTVSTVNPGVYTTWASQTLLGCESDRVSLSIRVYDSVIAGFNWVLKYGCKADTVTFTNTSFQTSYYKWSFGDGTTSEEKTPVHIYTRQGIDTLKLFARSATCIDSSVQFVSHVHPIHAQFLSDTNLICQGNKITFTDQSVGTTLSYLWNFGDGDTASSASPIHTYPRSGVYKAIEIVTDFVPCHDTAYRMISVDSISPIHIMVTDTVLCRGTYITFTGKYAAVGNTGINWSMGNGDTIKDVNPVKYGYDAPGRYTITAKALYRVCPDTLTSRAITVLQSPTINLGNDTTICKGGVPLVIADRTNNPMAGMTWKWNTGATTPAITVSEPGTYTATVRLNGCETSNGVKVDNDCYINIPNVFSPNGDGMNDYFLPRQYLTSGLTAFKMEIFNRWGALLFETSSVSGGGWDGKFNNVRQPVGVYVYMIEASFKDGQKEHHQGNVTLIR